MTAAAGDPVEEMLASYAGLTWQAMDAHLSAGDRTPYLDELVRDYPQRGGKGLRPALLLAACQAFGGQIDEALDVAVSVEMLHNAFLIHDDVQDGSLWRRGRPTLHALHGVPLAVNAGDALATLALRPLETRGALGVRVGRQVLHEVLAMILKSTEGQALELGWQRDNVVDLGPADYLDLVARKTCWYTTVAPLRLGALIGSRGTAELAPISRFGFYLGSAFQIRDDLLSVTVAGKHGKDQLGDLREGKRTLMLLHLMSEAAAADRAWLVEYLGRPQAERSDRDVARVHALMLAHGSLEFARSYAEGLAEAAQSSFSEAFANLPASEHLEFVRSVAPYLLARSR
jgi:geranylgeranyl diphosphate synthase, type II